MYDGTKVIGGIIVFLLLMLSPFLLNAGGTVPVPKPELPPVTKATKCVESAEFMKANHMAMLDDWRHEVVRSGLRDYESTSGEHFDKSLTRTCLDCHKNTKKFCDRCHSYAGVNPFCWECHVVPEDM